MPADAATSKLLESDSFCASRRYAESAIRDPEQLRELLERVNSKVDADPLLRAEPTAVNADIAAAMVDVHIEEITRDPGYVDALAPARLARIRLVVAGLAYLAIEQDVIPDSTPHGYVDDLTVLRWVVHVASGGEGVDYVG